MKLNSSSCIEKRCLLRGIPCVEFAVGSKAKHLIEMEKLTATDSNIEIKLVSAKHFFRLARRKDHEGYMWISRVLSNDCTNKECTDRSYVAKWCAHTTNTVAYKDFDKFMSANSRFLSLRKEFAICSRS